MLQQQHAEHDLSRRGFAAASLALLAALGQRLLDDEQQGVIFQRLSACRIQGSQRSSTASAIKPSANCRCRRRAAITAGAPVVWTPRDPGATGIDSTR